MILIHMPHKNILLNIQEFCIFLLFGSAFSQRISAHLAGSQASTQKNALAVGFCCNSADYSLYTQKNVHPTSPIPQTPKSKPPSKTYFTNQRNQELQFVCLCYVRKHKVLQPAENRITFSSLPTKSANTHLIFTHIYQSVSCQILI